MQTAAIDAVSLELTGLSWWMLIVVCIAAIAGAVWFYRQTVPPVTGLRRIVLTAVRMMALIFVIAGLAGPVLTITATATRPTVTVLLMDTSSSMDTPLDPGRSIAANNALSRLVDGIDGEVAVYTFDTGTAPSVSNTVSFEGPGTDLGNALEAALKHPDAAAVVLVSDGRWNTGRDPGREAASYPLPIHTVRAGSATIAEDISLTGLSASPVGRDGATLPLEITVSATTPIQSTVPVTVTEDDIIVVEGEIPPGSGTSALLRLDIPLRGTGSHRFIAEIAPANDTIESNNAWSFEVNVLKNSFAVLIGAAHPSADLAFLRRVVEHDSSFVADIAITGGAGGDVLEMIPADLTGYDAIILIDGAGELLTPDAAEAIRGRIYSGAGLWMLGSTPPSPSGASLEQALPIRFSGSGARADSSIIFGTTDAGRAHFITAQSAGADGPWSVLPPPGSLLPMEIDARSMTVLVEASSSLLPDAQLPAVSTGVLGSGKVLIMPLSGIWRWSLRMTGAGYEDDFLVQFASGALNWLTSPTDTSPLSVTTGTQSYLSGEAVQFEARLFDHIYSPVSGAELTITIDNDPAAKILLEETESGRYHASQRGIASGTHTFEAIATIGEAEYARATGSFVVQEYSLEQQNPTADPRLLQTLASATGGFSVTVAGVDSLFDEIEAGAYTERRTTDHHLALYPFLPFAAILLLLIEWGIRALRGMM